MPLFTSLRNWAGGNFEGPLQTSQARDTRSPSWSLGSTHHWLIAISQWAGLRNRSVWCRSKQEKLANRHRSLWTIWIMCLYKDNEMATNRNGSHIKNGPILASSESLSPSFSRLAITKPPSMKKTSEAHLIQTGTCHIIWKCHFLNFVVVVVQQTHFTSKMQ